MRGRTCVDCGESDPCVLDFDLTRGEKEGNISSMVGNGMNWQRIANEIAKCEIRCANCHRRKTARQCGWWQTRLGT
jgi:hypothetical protein